MGHGLKRLLRLNESQCRSPRSLAGCSLSPGHIIALVSVQLGLVGLDHRVGLLDLDLELGFPAPFSVTVS